MNKVLLSQLKLFESVDHSISHLVMFEFILQVRNVPWGKILRFHVSCDNSETLTLVTSIRTLLM